MPKAQPWVKALEINSKKLKEWSSLAPDGMPVLLFLLLEGHLDKKRYLTWAQSHYELPILGSEFFTKAFNPKLSQQLQSEFLTQEWKPWFFPVERWDDVTLVACVEPPKDSDDQFHFVLADPEVLSEKWSAIIESAAEESAEPPPMPMDVPTGLSMKDTPFKLTLDAMDETNLFSSSPPQAPPPPPALDAAEEPPIEETKEMTPEEEANLPDLAVEDAPPSQIPAQPPQIRPALTGGDLELQVSAQLEKLKTQFQHVLVMKCDDGIANLVWHDSTVKPQSKSIKVDLAFPTFLRIVAKTLMPYHGYLVDSPAHRDFFQNLSIKDLPGSVTALPIKVNQTLLGVAVGFGDESMQGLENLITVENLAKELVQILTSSWSNAA